MYIEGLLHSFKRSIIPNESPAKEIIDNYAQGKSQVKRN